MLAFASGFAAAKLRTEMARAPVLAHELRYVAVTGFVEAHELRDKGRARIYGFPPWTTSSRSSFPIACA